VRHVLGRDVRLGQLGEQVLRLALEAHPRAALSTGVLLAEVAPDVRDHGVVGLEVPTDQHGVFAVAGYHRVVSDG
jgi:hypothetical protein